MPEKRREEEGVEKQTNLIAGNNNWQAKPYHNKINGKKMSLHRESPLRAARSEAIDKECFGSDPLQAIRIRITRPFKQYGSEIVFAHYYARAPLYLKTERSKAIDR